MDNNRTLIIDEFDEHKGQFVINGFEIFRLIGIVDDGDDYYWLYYDGRELTMSSCVGSFIPLKNKIDEYDSLIRIAKLNHFDQICNDTIEQLSYRNGLIEQLGSNDKLMAEVCWDLN